MTKRMLKTKIDTLGNCGDVTRLIKDLNGLLAHSEGRLTYEVDYYEEYGAACSEFLIYEHKEESDEVYQKRMDLEQHVKDRQIANEKTEYERLKAKFGDGV